MISVFEQQEFNRLWMKRAMEDEGRNGHGGCTVTRMLGWMLAHRYTVFRVRELLFVRLSQYRRTWPVNTNFVPNLGHSDLNGIASLKPCPWTMIPWPTVVLYVKSGPFFTHLSSVVGGFTRWIMAHGCLVAVFLSQVVCRAVYARMNAGHIRRFFPPWNPSTFKLNWPKFCSFTTRIADTQGLLGREHQLQLNYHSRLAALPRRSTEQLTVWNLDTLHGATRLNATPNNLPRSIAAYFRLKRGARRTHLGAAAIIIVDLCLIRSGTTLVDSGEWNGFRVIDLFERGAFGNVPTNPRDSGLRRPGGHCVTKVVIAYGEEAEKEMGIDDRAVSEDLCDRCIASHSVRISGAGLCWGGPDLTRWRIVYWGEAEKEMGIDDRRSWYIPHRVAFGSNRWCGIVLGWCRFNKKMVIVYWEEAEKEMGIDDRRSWRVVWRRTFLIVGCPTSSSERILVSHLGMKSKKVYIQSNTYCTGVERPRHVFVDRVLRASKTRDTVDTEEEGHGLGGEEKKKIESTHLGITSARAAESLQVESRRAGQSQASLVVRGWRRARGRARGAEELSLVGGGLRSRALVQLRETGISKKPQENDKSTHLASANGVRRRGKRRCRSTFGVASTARLATTSDSHHVAHKRHRPEGRVARRSGSTRERERGSTHLRVQCVHKALVLLAAPLETGEAAPEPARRSLAG
ncbi:hypothetical protein B0H13DRAFT_1877227 [Mycena leptocephala]|nr:hypothetical protein B0H13DRAFT_1877227 [Mycena leptocephala]